VTALSIDDPILQPLNLTRFGDRLFLTGTRFGVGRELHQVPSRAGTTVDVVVDLNPGSANSSPRPLGVTSAGVVFQATDPDGVTGLWVSDGTQPGTRPLGGGVTDAGQFALLGPNAFAVLGRRPPALPEIWIYTQIDQDPVPEPITPVLEPGVPSRVDALAVVGSGAQRRLYANPYATATGSELHAVLVTNLQQFVLAADIGPGTESSFAERFAAVGDRVFAAVDRNSTGYEPWVIAPVPAQLRDIGPGSTGSSITGPTAVGDRLVFGADDGVAGAEPWVTDGTPAGTVQLADLNGSGGSDPDQFTSAGSAAVFTARNATGRALYRTDGVNVVELLDGSASFAEPDRLAAFRGGVAFRADQSFENPRLWWTDGTQAGTAPVAPTIGGVDQIAAGTDTLYFTRSLSGGVRELWSSDGTASGTVQRTLPPGVDSIEFGGVAGDRLYFVARVDGDDGMWAADSAGVRLLRVFDSDFGWSTSDPPDVGAFADGRLLFANNEPSEAELWISDGTAAGTEPLAPLAENPTDPYAFEVLNGWVYFAGTTPSEGQELWRSDGTAVEMITPTRPGPASSLNAWEESIEAVGDRLYYVADHADFGFEPWYLDVTPAVPAAPAGVTATVGAAGSGAATVSWAASADVPFAPITGYTVTSVPGGRTCSTSGTTSCTVTGLTAGTSYRFTVVATNRVGNSPASSQSNPVTPAAAPPTTPPTTPPISTPTLTPVLPARLLETRSGVGLSTVDGANLGEGTLAAGEVYELPVVNRGGVPGGASAVMLNVTAVRPSGSGYLTVFPCGEDVPNASNVNYVAGQVVPNAVLAKVGVGGRVCVFTFAETHLLIDVSGYVPAGS
jgi:ELWxxDGT repeat protein